MTACGRQGCSGSIVDGYCDTCGLAPRKVRGSHDARSGAAPPDRTQAQTATVAFDALRDAGGTSPTRPSSRRTSVGAGVVFIEPVEPVDPASVVLEAPSVPEHRRFCRGCDQPVGRREGDQQGRASGFCATCGTSYDFRPRLASGDVVAGQYEVVGALAHGGMGWVYLARDRNVSRRWCVLKGLLDEADDAAAEAAVAERRFLAEVSHPAIVDIHNFVSHDGQGYIVMQYVGGRSLKQIAVDQRRGRGRPMPVTEAAGYLLAALPALGYLHDRNLVYCDFKPDNVIHVEDSVKLIDLGGVRRTDDRESGIFGTIGYQAPEVPVRGPTVASDLYTVGRCLAVLILDWPAWQGADRERLPDRERHEILLEHDSLWRFLQRACAPDLARRFVHADEMADALYGVLCQVAAATDGEPRPNTSVRWNPPRATLEALDWATLPRPTPPNHPRHANRVAGIAEDNPAAAIELAAGLGGELSWADAAAVVLAGCRTGAFEDAEGVIKQLDPGTVDARGHEATIAAARSYLQGIVALAKGDASRAMACFDAAYATVPGEAACVLAFAAALETTGEREDLEQAAARYRQAAVADPSWVAAVAGLARTLVALDRPVDAAAALLAVPVLHPLRTQALTLACQAMGVGRSRIEPAVVAAASERLREAGANGRGPDDAALAVALYEAGLAALQRGETVGETVGDRPAEVDELARATEAALLDLAEATPDRAHRHELLDRAARIRPWTVW